MRSVPFPIVGGAYADESRPWSQQDTVNYLPTLAEKGGTRSQDMLKTPPGLKPYVSLPNVQGTVRGIYNADGKLFAVMGNKLYQISAAGVAIPLGTVPGLGRVSFTHNQISLGNEVVVVNGSAGYVWDTVLQTFSRITDSGFPGAKVVKFINARIVGVEPQGRYAFNSAPAQAKEYNTLDRFTSEVSPDPIVTLAVSNNELLLLSENTAEFFEDTGNPQQPFRSKRITLDKGCAGAYTVVEADNSLMWLGSDGVFYRLEGYSPRRISTRPIEQAIRGLDWSQAFGFLWEDSGYSVCYWTFPDGKTWGFDAANNEWHRRESLDLNRWRVSDMTRWRDEWYAGDFQSAKIWRMDWSYILEGDDEFVSERTCAVMHDNQSRVLASRLEVVMDVGQKETQNVGFPLQPIGPTITGAAPDGAVGILYPGFTYATVAGSSPITKTKIISGTLPSGLVWNESTATINSAVPTQTEVVTLVLRIYDQNGLFSDHEDTLEINAVWFAVNSQPPIGGGAVYAISVGGVDWTDPLLTVPGSTTGYRYMTTGGGKVLFYDTNVASISSSYGASWSNGSGGVVSRRGVYSQGFFYAGDSAAGISRTADGLAWSVVNPYVGAQGMAEKNGRIVIMGNNFSQYSDDGCTTLTPASVGFVPTVAKFPIDAGDGVFIAGSGNTAALGLSIVKSVDATSWSFVNHNSVNTSDYVSAIRFGGGAWVIGTNNGRILIMLKDETSFRIISYQHSTAGPWLDIGYAGSKFVIAGELGKMATASLGDLESWSDVPNSFETSNISSVRPVT